MISREADSNSPLPKILQVMGTIGVFLGLASLTLRGLSLGDLMLPAAALGLPIYLIVLFDPILGLAILIACIGLSPEFTVGGIRDLRAEDFMLPGILLGWLVRAGKERTPIVPGPLWAPAVISLLVLIVSTIVGTRGRGVSPAMPYLITAKYVEYFVIYLVILNTVRTPGEIRALAAFSILVALTSAVASLTGNASVVVESSGSRLQGPTGETSNIYGAYLGLHFLLSVGIFLHSTSPAARLAWGTILAVLGFAILYTYSRATYVAIGGALVLFGAVKYRRLLIIVLILSAVIPILAPESITNRLVTVGGVASESAPQSWVARLKAWEWALNRMTPAGLLFGMGIGSVAFGDVDSEYIRLFSDLGVLGVGLFAWTLFRLGRLANRTYDALPPDTALKGFLAGYLMAMILMMIHAIAATTFSAIRTEEAFMVLTALMTAIAVRSEEFASQEIPGHPAILLRDASILEPQRR